MACLLNLLHRSNNFRFKFTISIPENIYFVNSLAIGFAFACINDHLLIGKYNHLHKFFYVLKPNSIKPHTKFQGEVYVLTKEEGGRHTLFFNGYRP